MATDNFWRLKNAGNEEPAEQILATLLWAAKTPHGYEYEVRSSTVVSDISFPRRWAAENGFMRVNAAPRNGEQILTVYYVESGKPDQILSTWIR